MEPHPPITSGTSPGRPQSGRAGAKLRQALAFERIIAQVDRDSEPGADGDARAEQEVDQLAARLNETYLDNAALGLKCEESAPAFLTSMGTQEEEEDEEAEDFGSVGAITAEHSSLSLMSSSSSTSSLHSTASSSYADSESGSAGQQHQQQYHQAHMTEAEKAIAAGQAKSGGAACVGVRRPKQSAKAVRRQRWAQNGSPVFSPQEHKNLWQQLTSGESGAARDRELDPYTFMNQLQQPQQAKPADDD